MHHPIRTLRLPADRDALIALHRQYDAEVGFERAPSQYEQLADAFARHAELYLLVAAFDKEEPIAYARGYDRLSTSSCGNVVMLDLVWVRADRRGRGLGRRLMEYVAAQATARGAERIDLLVDEDNEPAIRLYEQFGFAGRRRLQMICFLRENPSLLRYFEAKRAADQRRERG